MNHTYRTLAFLGFATILVGLPKAVYSHLPPSGLVVVAQPEKKTSAVDLYNRGVDKLNSGNYQDAIADFSQALQIDPNDSDTYYNRGYAHHSLGNYEKAIADYSEAIRLNPQFAQAFSNRGYTYFVLKNYQQAINDATKAIELNRDSDNAYVSRGNAHDELGNSNRAYYNRGLTRNRLNQHQAAIQDYSEAVRLQPTFAEAYYNRGLSRFNLKNYTQAIEDLKKAADLFKENGRTENYKNAIDAIKTIQELANS
jgi:tetratricopeptide (TPR) repeat protein